ncbi:MAG: HEPN domain-containing protein [Planctomycetes bacterium]|nr:HEPN domain-containing protein [Planctomycetota bacterium]
MNPSALDHWDRAHQALRSAELLAAAGDHDGAASRAYYAAFHALSALFESEGRTFTKHTHIEAALHRDLIR